MKLPWESNHRDMEGSTQETLLFDDYLELVRAHFPVPSHTRTLACSLASTPGQNRHLASRANVCGCAVGAPIPRPFAAHAAARAHVSRPFAAHDTARAHVWR